MKIFCLSLLAVSSLWADGGKVLFKSNAGALEITLFASDSPVRIGKADLTVLVQESSTHNPVLDGKVTIRMTRSESGTVTDVVAPAHIGSASNKLLYAAAMDLKAPGEYRAEVNVDTPKASALVTGHIEVEPPEPPLLKHWPYFIALPILVLLFILNQRLKLKNRAAGR